MASKSEAPERRGTATAPVLLVPELVERMIAVRQAAQLVKFRTTFTDCVPS